MAQVVRSASEIQQQVDEAGAQVVNGGSKVPSMSYEEGVDYALRWVLGDTDDKPMDD